MASPEINFEPSASPLLSSAVAEPHFSLLPSAKSLIYLTTSKKSLEKMHSLIGDNRNVLFQIFTLTPS